MRPWTDLRHLSRAKRRYALHPAPLPANQRRRIRKHRRFMRSSRRTVWPKPKRLPPRRKRWRRCARRLEGFEGCGLKKTARQLVFADGNPQAKIMLIGEAPGRDEDAQGLPFVGRSGQLLDKMLAAIGLDRTKVYIGNVIYWRPPGNRTPTPDERAMCEPFIRRQIELVAPKVMMTLGGSALSGLFGIQGIMKTRGQVLTYDHGEPFGANGANAASGGAAAQSGQQASGLAGPFDPCNR
jgi:uracil-DNA glycosylase family 4